MTRAPFIQSDGARTEQTPALTLGRGVKLLFKSFG